MVNKAIPIIYVSLVLVALLLFLPVREALYLSYPAYRSFGLGLLFGGVQFVADHVRFH